ncbi:MAG TPA: glycosyltransferase [Proteobacteria bacterium]|nr:glycosyltransferase [Pseudomonadota bacterium]
MLVSAVVSTYNAERFIEGRLRNLLAQSLFRKGQLEIIVIDAASQEGESSIVRDFALNNLGIRYYRCQTRETVYASWNRGVNLSRGQYFINANSDDLFVEDGLERLVEVLEKRQELGAVYGDWYYTVTENDSLVPSATKTLHRYPDFYSPLLFYLQVTSHALMVRRELFEKIGYFDDKMVVCGDRDWVFRFAVAGFTAFHLSQPIGLYLHREDSLERSQSAVAAQEFDRLLKLYTKPREFASLHGQRLEVPGNQELARLFAVTGALGIHFATRDKNGSLRLPQQTMIFFRRALAMDPDNFTAANNLAVLAALQGKKDFAIERLVRLSALAGLSMEKKAQVRRNLAALNHGCRDIDDFMWHSGDGQSLKGDQDGD